MDLRFVEIPKLENDVLLEELIKDLFDTNDKYVNVNVHGRPGQKQDGVDVFARNRNLLEWVGVQCKVRSTNKSFTKEELLYEVNQAKNFNPKITKYFLYTTLSRDTVTQANERAICNELDPDDDFVFQIMYWEDITQVLKQPEFMSVYYRYYYKYFKDNQTLGHVIGKVLNLDLQFDGKPDTHFELIIGKIPSYKGKTFNADYYRGIYFIINLNEKKIDFFAKSQTTNGLSLVPSDIQYSIDNRIDAYRVYKWLTAIENIDDFIYDNKHDYHFSISSEERWRYTINDD